MTASKDDLLLHYYAQELAYLRQAGRAFAERYPKIGARLQLDETTSPDPHVERLIESFAFLTGRIQYNIDSEFPLFTTALLGNLYPHYLQPTPSMVIAQFLPDFDQGDFTGGYPIERHTPLLTRSPEGEICRFRTCFPLRLWPLQITQAQLEPPQKFPFLDRMPEVVGVLRLRFDSEQGDLATLELNQLRLHLHGSWLEMAPLYELLGLNLRRIALFAEGSEVPQFLDAGQLQPAGFEDELLPYPVQAQPAYRLLHEYFIFPEKFLFYDLEGLERLRFAPGQRSFELLFLLDQRPPPRLRVDHRNFRLGCTPVVNLFTTLSEPLRIHHRLTEYRLNVDARKERTTEIYAIRQVTASSDRHNSSQRVQPYFSCQHGHNEERNQTFWYARRTPTVRPGQGGSDLYLHFLDLDFNPQIPPHQTLYAHLYCTNRHLATEVPSGGILQLEQAAPLRGVVTLNQPTEQVDAVMGGATVWRILSHLNLNYLSLSNDEEGLGALQEILRLYNFRNQKAFEHQIRGIQRMRMRKTVRRLGEDAWRGFVRGYEVELELDPGLFVGGSALLLASVLERFFALYASTNSFTQLHVKLRGQDALWKKWPPRVGRKLLL